MPTHIYEAGGAGGGGGGGAGSTATFITSADETGTLANSVRAATVLQPAGVVGSRPSASAVPVGSLYFGTDTLRAYRSNGTTWDTLPANTDLAALDARYLAIAAQAADSAKLGGVAAASYVGTGDARLSDARTPTAHAATHAAGGGDAVTLTEAQVTGLTADLAAKLGVSATAADSSKLGGTAAASFVQAARALIAGTGLTGGGDLSADRTLGLASIADQRMFGNVSGGAAAPVALTVAQVKTLLALATGDISGLGTVATLASDTDTTLAANSDSRVATQKATKAYTDAHVASDPALEILKRTLLK